MRDKFRQEVITGDRRVSYAYIAVARIYIYVCVYACNARVGLVLRNLTKDANMTQYDQCSASGATARIDYQRGEALDVIMLTTEKEKEKTPLRAGRRRTVFRRWWEGEGTKIDERWEHPEEYTDAFFLSSVRYCLLHPRRSCELFSLNLYPARHPRARDGGT